MVGQRQRYFRTVERLVKSLHRRKFHVLWTRPSREEEWCGRFQITQNLAFQFAVLYRHTGKAAYLELAKRYLLDFDSGYHFGSLFLGKAYELIKESLTTAERRDFAEEWVAGADAGLETYVRQRIDGDVKLINRWDHVTNHALCACVYADYARKLFPSVARDHAYETVTDRVWAVWWGRIREFQEQASNYEGFSECFLCAWADLRGETGRFYRSPTVANMLARGLDITSPSGIVAAYGDSGHHEHASAWIALFERAAAETGDGQYRQVAMDAFSCLLKVGLVEGTDWTERALELNPYNGRVLYGSHLHALSWLAMAALWADEGVKPTPREVGAKVISRVARGYRLRSDITQRAPAGKQIPCQVALQGGPSDPARRTFMLLSTGPKLGHDHADAGSILLLSRGQTVLLGTNGYLQRELLYHNTFYAQPQRLPAFPEDGPGKALEGDDACFGRIDLLESDAVTARCRVVFERYHGLPLTVVREFLISPDGTVALLDRATAQRAGLSAGVLFHAERIRKVSPGVFDLRTEALRSMCGMAFTNPPGSLRVELEYPNAEARVVRPQLPSIYQAPGYSAFPCNHYTKVWRGSYTARKCLNQRVELTKGQEHLFVTRLVPVSD